MDIQKDFGEAIKTVRKSMHLSQEKVALMIGMDRTYYASIENGKRNVSLINIEKIARGYNLSLEELFRYVDEEIRRNNHD